ncbi:MAG: hypothetical protein AAGE05_13120 [Pseudomonadota bacterium]
MPTPSASAELLHRLGNETRAALDEDPLHGVRARHDGWTRKKMVRFLQALAETASVTDAAAAVGMSRSGAYKLRARLSGQPFDLAWEAALEHGLNQLAHSALDRAMNGIPVPIVRGGEIVGERRVYNERLTMFMLTNPGAVGRLHRERKHALGMWDGLLETIGGHALTWDDLEAEVEESVDPETKERIAREVSDEMRSLGTQTPENRGGRPGWVRGRTIGQIESGR